MDHIGGVDAVIRQIGYDIPVYGTPLTVGIIKKRQEEFAGSLKLIVFDPDNTIYFGKLKIGFFRVNHNIPDSVAVCVHTPGGIIVHTGDWKLDHSPVNEEAMNFLRAAEIGKQGVLALLADSTSAYLPGYALSEDEIKHNIDDVFRKTSGRIITACFSTLIARIQQLILLSEKYDRKVCILGRSMLNNVEVALNLDYMKIKKGTIISSKQAKTIDPSKVTIICTGAQGEGNASLTKVAKGEHKDIVMEDNDAVLFSSSVIKGNERSIQNLRDIIAKHNIEVYHYHMMDVHAGGHAKSEETKLMANLLRPKYFIPIEANYFMLKEHAKVIQTAGFPKERIFIPSNGAVLSITEKDAKIEHDVVSHNIIAVEGKTIGPLTDIVMNDRNQMAESGIFNIIINAKARKNINNPDIISRGYIYMKESKPLVEEARRLAKNLYEKAIQDFDGNIKDTKRHITTKIEELLFEKVGKVPLVIVVINDITTKDGHDDAELDEEGNILTSNNTIENTNINERNIIDNT
jgi:ribonuclease J